MDVRVAAQGTPKRRVERPARGRVRVATHPNGAARRPVASGATDVEVPMPTRTRQRTTVAGRFSRLASRPAAARRRSRPRRGPALRPRRPEQSPINKAMSKVTGALPRRRGKSAGRQPAMGGRRRAGGLALLAAGAGLAARNRDKLAALARGGKQQQEPEPLVQSPADGGPVAQPAERPAGPPA